MTGSAGTIIYDDHCPFCRRQVDRIRRRDREGIFACVGRSAPDLLTRFPALAGHDFNTGLRLVAADGGIHVGADAVYEIARRLPVWRALARTYRIPGLRLFWRTVYRIVARNRQCDDGECELPDRR